MSMMLLVVAQAVAVPAPAPPPYPAEAVLEAFGEACRNVENLQTVEADLADQQWEPETPPADSPLDQLLAMGRSKAAEILDKPDDRMSDTRVFTKTIEGERLDIILSSVESEGTFVNGCRMYDVGEERQIGLANAQKWIGRDANQTLKRDEISIAKWSPGYDDGHDSFEIFFVPAGSPLVDLLKMNGIALKADFVGETEK